MLDSGINRASPASASSSDTSLAKPLHGIDHVRGGDVVEVGDHDPGTGRRQCHGRGPADPAGDDR